MKQTLRTLALYAVAGLAACLALAITFVVIRDRIESFSEKSAHLTQQIAAMETLVAEKEDWKRRYLWIDESMPRFSSYEEAAERLLENIADSISRHDIGLNFQELKAIEVKAKPLPSYAPGNFLKTSVEITVLGKERDIVHWIHDLQAPGKFTAVNRVAIEVSDLGLLCELNVTQYFLGEERSPYTLLSEEKQIHHVRAEMNSASPNY